MTASAAAPHARVVPLTRDEAHAWTACTAAAHVNSPPAASASRVYAATTAATAARRYERQQRRAAQSLLSSSSSQSLSTSLLCASHEVASTYAPPRSRSSRRLCTPSPSVRMVGDGGGERARGDGCATWWAATTRRVARHTRASSSSLLRARSCAAAAATRSHVSGAAVTVAASEGRPWRVRRAAPPHCTTALTQHVHLFAPATAVVDGDDDKRCGSYNDTNTNTTDDGGTAAVSYTRYYRERMREGSGRLW